MFRSRSEIVFKYLYFADREHLAKYGSTIIEDRYIAMKYGAVPSIIYDAFKAIRGDGDIKPKFQSFYNAFEIKDKYILISKEKSDIEELSDSEIECLDKNIEDNKNLDFDKLSKKAHDDIAWKNADRDDIMDILDIAESGGASKEMLKYITENRECRNIALA